ncbi:MAG: MFS transporter [Planctomycetaceae bacterium]
MNSQPAERPTNVRWWIFGLGCGTSWILYVHRFTFGLIKPIIGREWGLNEIELGWLDSAFSFTYMFGQVPAGLLGDLIGAHIFLSVTILAWSVALWLHTVAPNMEWMVPVRVLFGLAQAGCYSMLSKISKLWFPRSIRTVLQGWIASFFGRMGAAMSNLLFGFVLLSFFGLSWRPAITLISLLGIVFAVVFYVVFRNTPREHPQTNDAEVRLIEGEDAFIAQAVRETEGDVQPAPRMTFREMFAGMTPRSLWNFFAFLVQQFTSTFPDMIYGAWVPYFLSEVRGLDLGDVGLYASLPFFGGAVGGAVGGALNDYLILKIGRRWARSLVGGVGKIMAAVCIGVALLNYDDYRVFCITLFFVKFFADWSQPTVWGTVTDIGGKSTATVFGFNNMIGGLGGVISPVAFAYIASYMSWMWVFIVTGLVYLLSAVSWFFVNCTIPLMQESDEEKNTQSDSANDSGESS